MRYICIIMINHLFSLRTVKSNGLPAFCSLAILLSACNSGQSQASGKGDSAAATVKAQPPKDSTGPAVIPMTPVDTALYNAKNKFLANGDSSGRWPVHAAIERGLRYLSPNGRGGGARSGKRAHVQLFTAPAVRPETMYRLNA